MKKIRGIWNKIPNLYKGLGALVISFNIAVAGDNLVNNRTYATFDQDKGLVRYNIFDKDGFNGYRIINENGEILRNTVYRTHPMYTPIDKPRKSEKGYLKLPSGKHKLQIVYKDGDGHNEEKVMRVKVPKYSH